MRISHHVDSHIAYFDDYCPWPWQGMWKRTLAIRPHIDLNPSKNGLGLCVSFWCKHCATRPKGLLHHCLTPPRGASRSSAVTQIPLHEGYNLLSGDDQVIEHPNINLSGFPLRRRVIN